MTPFKDISEMRLSSLASAHLTGEVDRLVCGAIRFERFRGSGLDDRGTVGSDALPRRARLDLVAGP